LMAHRSSISSQSSPKCQTQNETASQVHPATSNPVPGRLLRATRLSGRWQYTDEPTFFERSFRAVSEIRDVVMNASLP
jgi:hypothetical protein